MDVHGSSALFRSISLISANPCFTYRYQRVILDQKTYSPESHSCGTLAPYLKSAVYHKERFKMRASYKNTSVALLVTLALSLFFVYAMRPNEAAGSEATPHSAEWKNSSSVKVALETLEEVGPKNFDDDDFKITITSATTNAIRTAVTCSLESDKNTQHRIEFYTSQVCGPNGLESPIFLGAVTVKTNNDGEARFTAIITPPRPAGHFISVKAINQKNNDSVVSACVRIVK